MVEWSDRRLSSELPHPRQLGVCQACGRTEDPREEMSLRRWIECDDADQSTETLIVLCPECAGKIIDPHPRLYRAVPRHRPIIGAMALCVGCAHQADLRCVHPRRLANGGVGLRVDYPAPSVGIACTRGKGGGCRQMVIYTGPVTFCDGRHAREDDIASPEENDDEAWEAPPPSARMRLEDW